MKKKLSMLFVAVCMVFCLSACSSEEKDREHDVEFERRMEEKYGNKEETEEKEEDAEEETYEEIIVDEPGSGDSSSSAKLSPEMGKKFSEAIKERKKTTEKPDAINDNPEDSKLNSSESTGKNNTSAVLDDTNAFVGTINGENVIGYLDTTYTYQLEGKTDYNATFITFDENNAPKYEIYIKINKDVPTGSYSNSGQNDKDKVFLTVYTVFNETSQKFGGSYTFLDSNKSWMIDLTNVQYSDDGVFKGTAKGTGMPGYYNSSPAYNELSIAGSFNFQMRTIHPTMETYRAGNSKYDAAHKVSYVQSFGTPYVGLSSGGDDSSGDNSSGDNFSVDHTCRTCGGTGVCQKCLGERAITNSYNQRVEKCPRCQGSGKCAVCYGKGSIN